ncbi:MAG: hypothetical protein NT013_24450 [Planctomycetia bacterium]|nr:hypothetical protein [Planctomycetia bacterium]
MKLLNGHLDNGGSHEQAADRLKVTKALLGSEFCQSATSERSNDHAERTNRRQTESLGRISHGQIVGQQQWNRLLTTNEKRLAFASMKFVQRIRLGESENFRLNSRSPRQTRKLFQTGAWNTAVHNGLIPHCVRQKEFVE